MVSATIAGTGVTQTAAVTVTPAGVSATRSTVAASPGTITVGSGVATLTVESIRNQDFPVVQCAVILLALLIVGVNLIVDLVVGIMDPRIRAGT